MKKPAAIAVLDDHEYHKHGLGTVNWEVVAKFVLIAFIVSMIAITTFRFVVQPIVVEIQRQATFPTLFKSVSTGTLTLRYPDGREEVVNTAPEDIDALVHIP